MTNLQLPPREDVLRWVKNLGITIKPPMPVIPKNKPVPRNKPKRQYQAGRVTAARQWIDKHDGAFDYKTIAKQAGIPNVTARHVCYSLCKKGEIRYVGKVAGHNSPTLYEKV